MSAYDPKQQSRPSRIEAVLRGFSVIVPVKAVSDETTYIEDGQGTSN
jgi:hypothetical protein